MAEPVPAPTLLSAWATTVAAAPEAVALIECPADRVHTRAELDALATAFASALPPTVARRRVAFALPNGAAWFAAFVGLLRAGATPVPLDPSEPAASQLRLAAAARAPFAWIDGQLVRVSDVRLLAPRSLLPALIKLTSGSTGTPRALAFSHAQMLADGRQVCASMDIRPADRNLCVIPFGHSYGLGNLVVPLLAQGSSLVCVDTPLPHALAAASARHRPTVFPAVPALLRALAEAELPADAFDSLRVVISAGSPLPAATALAFHARFGLKPHGFYGSSETGGIAYDRSGDETLAGTSVGTPLDGVSIEALPRKRVRVRSAAVLRAGGHIPADRARLEPDGRIVLLGRSGRLHKIGGRRLDLGELEATLRALPDIADAFVAPHPEDPEQLAAVLATPLPPPALRTLLRAHLAAWKIPRRLVPVSAFPLTARGKPDNAALHALIAR
jgi:long-chain acyl-CoA synthetase